MHLIPERHRYRQAFETEAAVLYPVVDALEARYGFALDPDRLLPAAEVLACPVKAAAPNWQHGRVLYAVARGYLVGQTGEVMFVDVGTAKGFSALCLQWALRDSGRDGKVVSIDVINPDSHARRNTVVECDGLKTLGEILAPWPDAAAVQFVHDTGAGWLKSCLWRIHLAYIDGKHDYYAVSEEIRHLRTAQQPGDVVVFDDLQIPGVARAVAEASRDYELEQLEVLPNRQYAIGRRR